MAFPSIQTIGRGPRETSTHVVDELLGCHRRIRHFLFVGREVGDALGVAAGEVAEAAAAFARYFQVALPLHAADEDLSLRPRLERAPVPRTVREALARMSAEHGELDAILAELVPAFSAVAAYPSLLRVRADELARGVAALAAAFTPHLRLEEDVIFPAVRGLAAGSLAEIRAEMRARRGP
jgi:hemerythrin-like domain-containing protein